MDLTIENLSKIKRISDEVEGSITWNDLLDLFGIYMWNWEKMFPHLHDYDHCFTEVSNNGELNEIDKVVKAKIMEALYRADFVQKDAAMLLRITPRQLNYSVGIYNITHPSWRRNKS